MAIDLSGVSFFLPLFSFLLVFVIIYAVLFATKILGDSKGLNLFVSFIIAVVFISVGSLNTYIQNVIPWVAVLFVVVFLFIILLSFQGSKDLILGNKVFGGILIAIMIIIFIIAAIKVFNPILKPYLPGSPDSGGDTILLKVKNFVYSSKFLGAVALLLIAFIVAKILMKK